MERRVRVLCLVGLVVFGVKIGNGDLRRCIVLVMVNWVCLVQWFQEEDDQDNEFFCMACINCNHPKYGGKSSYVYVRKS